MRRTAAAFASIATSLCLWTGGASADVDLVNAKGWRVYTNGRLNGFYSYASGDGFPTPPAGATYSYIGGGLVGQPGLVDEKNNITSTRILSGFIGSILAVGVQKDLAPGTALSGYFAVWSGIQTDHTRFHGLIPDVREGYLKVEGSWGSVLVGRALGLFGKAGVEIDFNYGHGNGLGYPCQLEAPTVSACGQTGFGVLYPFYAAGIVYKTPSLAGLALAAGLYDPVAIQPAAPGGWALTPLPRPEAELSYDLPLGDLGKLHVAAEGMWQKLGRVGKADTTDALAFAGGARLEIGPARLGVSGYSGTGLGFSYPLEDTPTSVYTAMNTGNMDPTPANEGKLRTSDGYYGQLMLVLGSTTKVDVHHPRVDIAGGYGAANLHRIEGLDVNRNDGGPGNPGLAKQQAGINGGVFYHFDDNLVASLDYFRANFSWQDGQKQAVNAFNAGMAMTW